VLLLGRPTAPRLDELLGAASSAGLTYAEVGATREAVLPGGYHHGEHVEVVGRGKHAFDRAADGLRRWQSHAGLRAAVHPPDAVLHPGNTVLVLLGAGPVHVIAPCRIVYVVDEPDRFGFGYGTLPGHPERGEESFVAERDESDAVRLSLRVFSRPDQFLVRLAGPVGTTVQNLALRAYGRGLRRYVDSER